MKYPILASVTFLVVGCTGKTMDSSAATLSPIVGGVEHTAMMAAGQDGVDPYPTRQENASLWNGGRASLFGDRRAVGRGDILTVKIEIDDRAEISNSSSRSRSAGETLSLPSLFGIPQRVAGSLPTGASLDPAIDLSSQSTSSGDGAIRRNEKLTLRVAATVIEVQRNGVLRIRGSQEVRVNSETRELWVDGYVRPEDISRQNEVTYDKIASARISYGGRGQVSSVQTPRSGQSALNSLLPF